MKAGLAVLSLATRCGAVSVLLAACQPTPECPFQAPDSRPSNAGCLVIHRHQVLLTVERTGRVSLPGGTQARGESAQCTAFRETWEETGIRVTVGPLLKQFDNGFRLFRCDAGAIDTALTPVPGRPMETPAALWLTAQQLDHYPWRFPAQRPMVKEWIADSGRAGQQ